ncbi:MAG: hypothetical protein ACP5F1_02805 [Thermoplasmata archaeon]|nr:hypothetical protein [Thermoplasmata archaeon]
MDQQGAGKLKVETFWKEHCPYCKKNETCKFHKIFEIHEIDPTKADFMEVRKFNHGKKFSVRILYNNKKNGNIELSLSIPNNQITVIEGSGKDRKSILTLVYSENVYHELFLIGKEDDIKKLKIISNENFKKIYKNSIGD